MKKDDNWPESLGGVTTNASDQVKSVSQEGDRLSYVCPEDADTANEKINTASEAKKKENVSYSFNLIILDESGSMASVQPQTVTGCNETLNSIRNTVKEHPEIKQIVSIFCFDSSNSRYLFCNKPIEEVADLSLADYRPNACTPLYDAIGYTVKHLEKVIKGMDAVGLVTIITDGYENASRRWNHQAVVELINSLKEKGWVFTFIGANIDVEVTARDLGIDSYMAFEQSNEGMSEMFEKNARSQRAYSEKRRYLEGHPQYKT